MICAPSRFDVDGGLSEGVSRLSSAHSGVGEGPGSLAMGWWLRGSLARRSTRLPGSQPDGSRNKTNAAVGKASRPL